MPTERIQAFVSSTSADLGSCRRTVADALFDNGIYPEIQDHFEPDYKTLIEVLTEKIASSDVVICLVGETFGAAPSNGPSPPKSYTQLEYEIARELDKVVYLFITSHDFQNPAQVDESPQLKALQQQYRESLFASDYKWNPLSDPQQLYERILVLVPLILQEAGSRQIRHLHVAPAPSFFAGRGEELNQLRLAAAQKTPAIIAVVGMGGQGKTTLVCEWLRRQKGFLFARGFWCSAYQRGFTFDIFLDKVLEHLLHEKFVKQSLPSLGERIERLLLELQRRRTLLVIDGIERWLIAGHTESPTEREHSPTKGRAALFEGLDDFLLQVSGLSNGTHLIITTRALPQVLTSVEHFTVPVREPGMDCGLEGLSDEAACDVLRQAGLKDEQDVLLTEARQYGNHPLSLVVLASLAKNEYGGWLANLPDSISALDPAERLHELLHELRNNIPGGSPADRLLQIIAHCIEDPSLETILGILPLLSEKQTLGDRILTALFRQNRKIISELPQERDLRKLVRELHEWQLLHWNTEDRDRDRIHLHAIIKDFFYKDAPDSVKIHRRLSTWFSQLPLPDNPTSLGDVVPRRLAIEHSLLAEEVQRCAELLFGPLTGQYTYSEWLSAWGHQSHAIELLDRLIQICDPNSDILAEFLLSRSVFYHQLGFPTRIEGDILRAISLWEQSAGRGTESCRMNLAKSLSLLGNLERETGRSSNGVRRFASSIRILKELPQANSHVRIELAKNLVNCGNAQNDLGNWSSALADYTQAFDILKQEVWLHAKLVVPLLAWTQTNRGIVHGLLQDHHAALFDFKEAIAAYGRLLEQGKSEYAAPLASARIALAARLTRSQDWNEAINELQLATDTLQELHENGQKAIAHQLALAFLNRGRVHSQLRRWSDGISDCDQAVLIYRKLIEEGRPQLEGSFGHVLLIRAECWHGNGNREVAKADRTNGLNILRRLRLEWETESDIRIVYLEKLQTSLSYLLPDDADETRSIAHELIEDLVQIRSTPNLCEGLQLTASRILSQLADLSKLLSAKGVEVSQIKNPTDTPPKVVDG